MHCRLYRIRSVNGNCEAWYHIGLFGKKSRCIGFLRAGLAFYDLRFEGDGVEPQGWSRGRWAGTTGVQAGRRCRRVAAHSARLLARVAQIQVPTDSATR